MDSVLNPFLHLQPTSDAAREISGTEAIELLRQFFGALEHESLPDCARRAIATYETSPAERQNLEVVERAMVAVMLRLDDTAGDDRLLRWQHVFEAVEQLQTLRKGVS